MKRYELEDWADYVRGLGTEKQRRAMAEHLATAVDDSRSDVAMLEEVRSAIMEDAEDGTPEPWAWAAQAIFDLGQAHNRSQLPLIPLELVAELPKDTLDGREEKPYDPTRQLSYEGTNLNLVLWLEDPYEDSATAVLGQLDRADEAASPVRGASVVLLEDGCAVGAALTNDYGEFQIETFAEGTLQLRIVLRDEGQIDVAIPPREL
jgi:hypothetical protein